MDEIERAVSLWHRVYAQLGAARERLRDADPTLSGTFVDTTDELAREVDRLQNEEEQAMRAVRHALTSARKPARPGAGCVPPDGGGTA